MAEVWTSKVSLVALSSRCVDITITMTDDSVSPPVVWSFPISHITVPKDGVDEWVAGLIAKCQDKHANDIMERSKVVSLEQEVQIALDKALNVKEA